MGIEEAKGQTKRSSSRRMFSLVVRWSIVSPGQHSKAFSWVFELVTWGLKGQKTAHAEKYTMSVCLGRTVRVFLPPLVPPT